MSETTYQPGQHIPIGNKTIVLTTRRSATGIKWSWITEDTAVSAEMYFPTPRDAHAHAHKTLGAPPCGHRVYGWCPDCHDMSNR